LYFVEYICQLIYHANASLFPYKTNHTNFRDVTASVPLLKGTNDLDQFQKIMGLLGPPNRRTWPNFMEMPLLKSGRVEIPTGQFNLGSVSFLDTFGDYLSTAGIHFFSNLLQYDSKARWTAKRAKECEWFHQRPFPTKKSCMPTFTAKSLRK